LLAREHWTREIATATLEYDPPGRHDSLVHLLAVEEASVNFDCNSRSRAISCSRVES